MLTPLVVATLLSTPVLAAIIGAFGLVVASTVAAILNALFARRASHTLKSNGRKLETIHILVNGRLSEALIANAQALAEIADLRRQKANLTGDHEDHTEADVAAIRAARAISDKTPE